MWRRYSIIPVFFVLIAVVAWWANRVESSIREPASQVSQQENADSQTALTAQRRELLEVLDRAVAYEFYYRSVYGHFTKLLHRVGVAIPQTIRDVYDIRVVEASSHRLLITAISEVEGRNVDLVSIDQDYRLNANFPLPAPRSEFLQSQALKHIRTIESLPASQTLEESGIYQGYFRFEVTRDSQNQKSVIAYGLKAPVLGVQIDSKSGLESRVSTGEMASAPLKKGQKPQDPLEWGAFEGWSSASTGQKPVGQVMSTLEEAVLAQKIFRGETGRYAKDWAELAQIAAFRFKDQNQVSLPEVVQPDSQLLGEMDLAQLPAKSKPVRDLAGDSSASDALIVEPISQDSNL